MIQRLRSAHLVTSRTFKNFGHKRERIPLPTTLWHGFLTFTFIGAALEWDVISKFFFGDKDYDEELQKALSIGKVDDEAQRGTLEPGSAALFKTPLPRLGADETPKVLPRAAAPTLEPVDGVGSHTGPWLAPEIEGFGWQLSTNLLALETFSLVRLTNEVCWGVGILMIGGGKTCLGLILDGRMLESICWYPEDDEPPDLISITLAD